MNDQIYQDFKKYKKNGGEIVFIKQENNYYTYDKDKEYILNVIKKIKLNTNYEVSNNEIRLDTFFVLQKYLVLLKQNYLVEKSSTELNNDFKRIMSYNSEYVKKCENCKEYRSGRCYGTKMCEDFIRVNPMSKNYYQTQNLGVFKYV